MCVFRATHPTRTGTEDEDQGSRKRTSNSARGQEDEREIAAEEKEDVKPNCVRRARSRNR